MSRIAAVLTSATVLLGCSQHTMVDYAVSSAYRPDGAGFGAIAPRYQLLAGDLHCHVSPPDDPSDVQRDLDQTIALARDEHVDFIVFTPHVWSRFFADPELRAAVVAGQRTLATNIEKAKASGIVLIAGMEYTDHAYGHLGMAFADIEKVLSRVSVDEAKLHPERFIEEWVGQGGTIVINHPLVTPLDSMFAMARADLSWRPFTSTGTSTGTSTAPFPAEINAATRLAHGLEAFNLTVSHIRDRYLLHDGEHTLRKTLARIDHEIVIQKRRIAALGGTDSHGMHLRATTFVLAERRDAAAVHDAIVAGRTCVRDSAACSFTAAAGKKTVSIGGALDSVRTVDVKAHGDDIEIFLDSEPVAKPSSDQVLSIPVPARCSVLRSRVGEGFSGPIYLNCPFA